MRRSKCGVCDGPFDPEIVFVVYHGHKATPVCDDCVRLVAAARSSFHRPDPRKRPTGRS